MGFGAPEPQGTYPNMAPGQAYAPQGYPQPAAANTAYPPMDIPNNDYPPTGAVGTAAGSSGVTAPGGYTATPATGPPGDGRYIPEATKPPPAGYPNDAYPPQGSAQGPATGYPVHHAAPPAGLNVSGPHTTSTTAVNHPNEPCRCSVGWVLFGVGWIFPVCWVVGTFIPLCTKTRNDRRAAFASLIALIIYIVLIIAVAVTQSRNGGYYYNRGYYNNGYHYNG